MAHHTQRDTRSGYPTYSTPTDATSGFGFTAAGKPTLNSGGVVEAIVDGTNGVALKTQLSITGGASDSSVFESMANPWGYTVIITRAILRITTGSTGASTLDIGVGANATTSNDGLIDGLSGATAGLFDSANDTTNGTNGAPSQVWASTGYLNVAEASGDVAGLVGTLYIEAVKA